MPKIVHLASFWKPEACGQTVLPDRSLFIEYKLVENAQIENIEWDFFGDFHTLCTVLEHLQCTKFLIIINTFPRKSNFFRLGILIFLQPWH